MNKFRPVLLLILFILLGGGISAAADKDVYYCPMHPTYTAEKPADCPICNMKLVKREEAKPEHSSHSEPKVLTLDELKKMKPGEICLLHKCKMGTCMIAMTDEAARLGKCPHCGEDLNIIIKDLMPAGYSHLKLSPEKQQMIGVKTAPAKKIHMTKTIRASGRIAYDPDLYQMQTDHLEVIKPYRNRKTGKIKRLNSLATREVNNARLGLKVAGMTDETIAELEKIGKADRSLIYSEPGGRVWLYFPIYEYEIPLVKPGDKVQVEIFSMPGKKMEGTVRSLDTVLDPMTRSVRVRAVLENPEGILRPEMYVNVELKTELGEALAVPEEAVFATGEKNIVFVARVEGYFEPREVVPGISSGSMREIKSGLSEGEKVVVSGNFLMDSESRLKGALEGLSAGGGGHQHG